jgi:hypothetical protein
MLEQITLGEIAVGLSFLVGFFGGIGYFYKNIKKWLEKIIQEQFEPFSDTISDISGKVNQVDMESCKNYLVRCLGDFEHGNPLSDVEQERFWEEYQHYLKIGGNSYIERRVEKLKLDGKL